VVADLNLSEKQQARLGQILDGMLRERAGQDGPSRADEPVDI
jgi:hypothetical protein